MKVRKLPIPTPAVQKVHAATRRMTRHGGHERHDEPNMKLSHAFIVVLVLHVVAVGGIYAFNSIKTHRERAAEIQPRNNESEIVPAPSPTQLASRTTSSPSPRAEKTKTPTPPPDKPPPKAEKLAEKTESKLLEKTAAKAATKPLENAKPPKDSGKVYTVVKGDNPVSIARKLDVDYDALLRLNQIQDPRRLQIGQKLHVPVKTKGG